MVDQGRSAELYRGADGINPPKVIAGPGTPIYEAVREYHLQALGYYIYPPLLADLLVPLTHLDLFSAWKVWLGLSVLLLFGTVVCLIFLLNLPLFSPASAVLFLALFCYAPVMHCLAYGQVTILLLFLWCLGVLLQIRGKEAASAAVFAFATAIKLTPALVLVPFLFWRRWRWVGWFVAVLAALGLLCALLNTWQTLITFILRVMPAMSNAIPDAHNFSLPAITERLVMALHGSAYHKLLQSPSAFAHPFYQDLPAWIFVVGKAASLTLLLGVLYLLQRRSAKVDAGEQRIILSVLGLVCVVLSPVSWFNAYAVAFITFAVLWYEVLVFPCPPLYLFGLACVSILVGSPALTNITTYLVSQERFLAAAGAPMVTLVIASLLVLYRFAENRPHAGREAARSR